MGDVIYGDREIELMKLQHQKKVLEANLFEMDIRMKEFENEIVRIKNSRETTANRIAEIEELLKGGK